jgi:hypothetical protein
MVTSIITEDYKEEEIAVATTTRRDEEDVEGAQATTPSSAPTDATLPPPEEPSTNKKIHMKVAADAPWTERMWEVVTTFWPLGFVAFGGPQAHVAILRDHLVVQRDWLDEDAFMELFAIGQVRTMCKNICIFICICRFCVECLIP